MSAKWQALREFQGSLRFSIQRELGAGGMGVVYEALDRETGTTVALKALRAASADAILRMKREFRALQELQHANLVNLGELLEEDGTWFFTMELVRGVSFLEHVRPGGAVGDADTIVDDDITTASLGAVVPSHDVTTPAFPRYDDDRLRDGMAQLARGLLALHGAGKVHRDVKPSNILVERSGRVVLLDFGLVTEADPARASSATNIVGTAAYMAPEQALGRPVGPEADWYAVGVILYEALLGRLPFDGHPLEILLAKQRAMPPSPRSLRLLPKDLDEICMGLLEIDPARRLSGVALLHRLGATVTQSVARISTGAAAASTYSAPFVGRERELTALFAGLDAVRAGHPISIFIHGESGIGKSALVRAFTERAAADDRVLVLAGRCHEREAVPYKAMDGVIDALARFMQRLPRHEAAELIPQRASLLLQVFPVLRQVDALAAAPRHYVVDPQELRTRVFAAMRELFLRLAERRTLIVAIDDLQWADADGLALLAELMQWPEPPPLLLVASWREAAEDQDGVRRRLDALPGEGRHLKLQPLPEEAARELAHRLLARAGGSPASDAASAATIAAEASGHPLFIDELVRHTVLAQGESRPAPARRARLEDVLHARIQRLDSVPRRVLEVVAVAGTPVDQETAARAAGVDLVGLGRMVALLRVGNLVRTIGSRGSDTVEAYHDRVRAAVLEHLTADELRARHRELARALEASGRGDPKALAEHYQGAGDRDKAGHHAAQAAAVAAAALAFDQAVRFYELALSLLPEDTPSRRTLRVALGDALANGSRGAEAARAYIEATIGAAAAESLDLQRRAAQQLLLAGHIDEGLAAMRSVLAAEGISFPATPRRALASIVMLRARLKLRGTRFRERDETSVSPRDLVRIDVCFHVGVSLGLADNVRGQVFVARGLLLALRAGEPYRLARALAVEGVFVSSHGDLAAGEQLLATAERLAARAHRPYLSAFIVGCRGQTAWMNGCFSAALDLCRRAELALREECVGVSWELSTTRLWECRAMLMLGDLAALARRLSEVLQDSERRGDLFGITNLRTAVAPYLHLAADDVAAARREVTDALGRWSISGFQIQHYFAHVASVSASLYEQDGAAAHAAVEQTWPDLGRAFLFRIHIIRIVMADLRGRAALAALSAPGADQKRLLGIASRQARQLRRQSAAWAQPLAAMLRAGVARHRGDVAAARDELTAAARGFDEVRMRLHAAAARLALGRVTDGDDGRRMILEAEAVMRGQRVVQPARMAAMLAPGL